MNRTQMAVERQLNAFYAQSFEVGVREQATSKFTLLAWNSDALRNSVGWLKHKNANGHDIYVRPNGSLGIVLVDDLNRESIVKLKEHGLNPAMVIETSPKNYQAWIRLQNKELDKGVATRAAKFMAKKFNGDMNSADWRHFGRLAGFTNRKKRHFKNGRYPYVIIHEWNGSIAPMAEKLIGVCLHAEEVRKPDQAVKPNGIDSVNESGIYMRFAKRILHLNRHKAWSSNPDWSRMDWMIAKDMIRSGVPLSTIRDAIIRESPNLEERHKGRATKYVDHTLRKLTEQMT